MKHRAHQLITVRTKYMYIWSVTRLHRYTKITVYIFTVSKFLLEFGTFCDVAVHIGLQHKTIPIIFHLFSNNRHYLDQMLSILEGRSYRVGETRRTSRWIGAIRGLWNSTAECAQVRTCRRTDSKQIVVVKELRRMWPISGVIERDWRTY